MSCGVGRRRGSDLALLLLYRRPAATAPIRPLAWELPYAAPAAPKCKKTKKPPKNYNDILLSTFRVAIIKKAKIVSIVKHVEKWEPSVSGDVNRYRCYVQYEDSSKN